MGRTWPGLSWESEVVGICMPGLNAKESTQVQGLCFSRDRVRGKPRTQPGRMQGAWSARRSLGLVLKDPSGPRRALSCEVAPPECVSQGSAWQQPGKCPEKRQRAGLNPSGGRGWRGGWGLGYPAGSRGEGARLSWAEKVALGSIPTPKKT